MIPYKRDLVTLNKSVINYLPRCSLLGLYKPLLLVTCCSMASAGFEPGTASSALYRFTICAVSPHVAGCFRLRQNHRIISVLSIRYKRPWDHNSNMHKFSSLTHKHTLSHNYQNLFYVQWGPQNCYPQQIREFENKSQFLQICDPETHLYTQLLFNEVCIKIWCA